MAIRKEIKALYWALLRLYAEDLPMDYLQKQCTMAEAVEAWLDLPANLQTKVVKRIEFKDSALENAEYEIVDMAGYTNVYLVY